MGGKDREGKGRWEEKKAMKACAPIYAKILRNMRSLINKILI